MIAVLGATGTIGSAVMQSLRKAGVKAVGFSKSHADPGRRLDLADRRTWSSVPEGVEAVLVSAGISDLRTCRERPAATRAINIEGTADFVRFVAGRGSFPVVVSTSYVFDGSRPDFGSSDAVCPRCEYGRQKAHMERAFCSPEIGGAVVRLTKVLSSSHPLVDKWRCDFLRTKPVVAADDANLSPLTDDFVGDCLAHMLLEPKSGIWQLSATDQISWWQLANRVRQAVNAPAKLLSPQKLESIDPDTEFVPAYGTIQIEWPFDVAPQTCEAAVCRLIEFADNLTGKP
jgi:dTDP-4-dehydrorhamnose reductase